MAKKNSKPTRVTPNGTIVKRYAVTDKGGTMLSIKKIPTGWRRLVPPNKREIIVGCFSSSYMDRFNSSLVAVAASMIGDVDAGLNMIDSDIDVAP